MSAQQNIFSDDPLGDRIATAIALLREWEPQEGYWLAFSGGKDSAVIHRLAEMAGVKFTAHYNVVTLDPPELVRHIKKHYPLVAFQHQKKSLLARMVERNNGPPTRIARWCCAEYKETQGCGYTKILGVRAAESPRRAKAWRPVIENMIGGTVVCPVVDWTDGEVWEFIKEREKIPYCSLYDEGWRRLGCIGCPMAGKSRFTEFRRWPKYEQMWKRAFQKWTERIRGLPRNDGGVRYFDKKFGPNWTWEMLWEWWMEKGKYQVEFDDHEQCQMELALATPMENDAMLAEKETT